MEKITYHSAWYQLQPGRMSDQSFGLSHNQFSFCISHSSYLSLSFKKKCPSFLASVYLLLHKWLHFLLYRENRDQQIQLFFPPNLPLTLAVIFTALHPHSVLILHLSGSTLLLLETWHRHLFSCILMSLFLPDPFPPPSNTLKSPPLNLLLMLSSKCASAPSSSFSLLIT